MLAIQLVICAVIGKLGAVFVTIPYPVLGGSSILSFGLFIGIMLSYLQFVDINLTRNMAVVGVSMLTGLMVPNWVKENSTAIKTGNTSCDSILRNPHRLSQKYKKQALFLFFLLKCMSRL